MPFEVHNLDALAPRDRETRYTNMIDVILISPDQGLPNTSYSAGYHWKDSGGRARQRESPNLGLQYIGAVLEKAGYSVRILDGNVHVYAMADIVDAVKNEKPRFIGVSSTTPTFQQAVLVARCCKEVLPDTTIVMGGYHPTYFHREIIDTYPFVDVVVRSEGEFTMRDIVSGGDLKETEGITYRHEGRTVVNPSRKAIRDLDELPFPARHLVPVKLDGGISGVFRLARPGEYATMITSRGCPFGCTFCVEMGTERGGYRVRSVENVAREVSSLAEQGIRFIQIQDMNFTASDRRVRDLCDVFRSAGIEWVCQGRVDKASEDLYREMRTAGCIGIAFGIESGSPKVLDYYNKRSTVQQTREAIRCARKAGLNVAATVIVGAPVETFEDVQETLHLLTSTGLDFLAVGMLNIFPYTPIWLEARKLGLIGDRWEESLIVSDVYSHPSREELQDWQRYIARGFYARPSYIATQIWRTVAHRRSIVALNLTNLTTIFQVLKSAGGVDHLEKL